MEFSSQLVITVTSRRKGNWEKFNAQSAMTVTSRRKGNWGKFNAHDDDVVLYVLGCRLTY